MGVFLLKKLFSVFAVLIALAVLFCIPTQAAETDNQFSLSILNRSNMDDVSMSIGVDDEFSLRLYAEGDALTEDTVQLVYDSSVFTLTDTVSAPTTSGISVSNTNNVAGGFLTVQYTVQEAPADGKFLLYTFTFKSKAELSDKYHVFLLTDPDDTTQASMDSVSITVNHVHVFSSWSYSVQPGLNEKGEMERTCSFCALKQTKEAPALSYNLKLKQDAQQILYDIPNDIYYAIKPGCTVSQLLAKFSYENTVKVLDSKNTARAADDIVCTGDRLVVYSATDTIENEALLSVCGDTDGDGRVNATDARNALRASVKLFTGYSEAVGYAMDSDLNNKIESSDARFLLRVSVTLDAFYPVEATGISLNKAAVTVYTDESVALTATVQPADTSIKSVRWTSSDTNVATVSAGRIIGVSAGTCVVTATTSNGKQASCNVTVLQSVEGFRQFRSTLYLPSDVSLDLTRYYAPTPSNAYLADCKWSVSNDAFTVQNAILTCKRAYEDVSNKTATVTLTAPNKISVSFNVTLIASDKSYCILNREVLNVPLGQTFTLGNFPDTSGRIVAFTSDNPSVVKVDEENRLVAVATGTAKISVKGFDYPTTCTVSVKSNLLSVQKCAVTQEDGASNFTLQLTNTSQKTISAMRFYVVGYTATGTVHKEMYCEIKNIAAGEDKSFTWSALWGKNATVKSATIKDISIVFSDNTTQKLTTDQVLFE